MYAAEGDPEENTGSFSEKEMWRKTFQAIF
jgi:hypothetical protein